MDTFPCACGFRCGRHAANESAPHLQATALFGKIHNDQSRWLCNGNNHTEPFTHIETECSPCGNYFPKGEAFLWIFLRRLSHVPIGGALFPRESVLLPAVGAEMLLTRRVPSATAAFVMKAADAAHTTMQTLPPGGRAAAAPEKCSVARKACPGAGAATYCPTDPDPHQCSSQESSHYSHAQYGNRSVAFIKNHAATKRGQPFFVFVGTTGPHLPAQPAPWHQAIADNMSIAAPRSPNFNALGESCYSFDLWAFICRISHVPIE